MDSRPPPPPHGSNPTGGPSTGSHGASNANYRSSHLPPGNYDIFVIPPHSSGSGFLYLPSMQPHRNSFLAGVACTLMAVTVWATVVPAIRSWLSSIAASGGMAILFLILAVGVLGWAAGKTQLENSGTGHTGHSGGNHQHTHGSYGFANGGSMPFGTGTSGAGAAGAGSKPFWQRSAPTGAGAASWEKAREETRKREENRRKQEDTDRDKTKAREREAREKAARERLAQERQRKENEAKAGGLGKDKEKPKDSTKSDPPPAANTSRNYQKPTAQSYAGDDDDDEYSYRPYDNPKPRHNHNSSYVSGSTYVPSETTAPPPRKGPYSNKDPEKITIKAVYAFSDNFPKPVAQLVSGVGNVTDGLVLKMSTEGLFIDDDVRGIGQREWDVKAWSLKLFETGDLKGKHVLRASVRDADNKRYVFIIDAAESWKVALGLQRLRRGTQVRSLGVSGLPTSETKALLVGLGWLRE